MPRGRSHASWLRQVESYLKDTGMAGLAFAWVMARRRPKEYRRKVDTALDPELRMTDVFPSQCVGKAFWPDDPCRQSVCPVNIGLKNTQCAVTNPWTAGLCVIMTTWFYL